MNQQHTSARLPVAAGIASILLFLALPVSVIMVRAGLWQPGLAVYALACAGASLVLLLFIALWFLPAYRTARPLIRKRALFTLPGAALMLSLFLGKGAGAPPIHDISTDTQEPPEFVTAAEVRGPDANPLAVKPESITQQVQAYPTLATMRNSDSLAANFERAIATAEAMGWSVYHRDPEAGLIEAVDSTALMAFKDDVVIRLRSNGSETLIDLRSVSRVGVGDLGANAERILKFQQAFGAGG